MQRIGLAVAVAIGVALAPVVVKAQQAGTRLARIGYLSGGSDSLREAAFRQGLRDHGYIEGQNIAIEPRFAEGKFEKLPAFAAELVRLKVDVIVSSSTPANRAGQPRCPAGNPDNSHCHRDWRTERHASQQYCPSGREHHRTERHQ